MKRSELKELIQPIVKECVENSVKEIILESGLLSQVISEVVKGMAPVIVEQKQEPKEQSQTRYAEVLKRSEKSKISETRRQLVDAIGKTSYNGVNVFEDIKETIPDERLSESTSVASPMAGISPSDSGVDISNLFDFNKANILAKGRKKG